MLSAIAAAKCLFPSAGPHDDVPAFRTSRMVSEFWEWLAAQNDAPAPAEVWESVVDILVKLVFSSQAPVF